MTESHSNNDFSSFPNILNDDEESKSFRNHLLYDIDPLESEIAEYLREKIWEVYSQVIFRAIYVSNDYLRIVIDPDNPKEGIQKINHFIASIISAYLVKGSVTLIEGSPGCGKTSTIRAISRMMTGSSIIKTKNIVHCDKGTVKESWMGKPNPKELTKPNGTGEWIMNWADWVKSDDIIDIIFDEVNRANPDLQAQALLLCADQKLQYDIEFSKLKPEIRVFMTMNPIDEKLGTMHVSELGYAFRDRITQTLDVPQADSYAMDRISKCRQEEKFLGFSLDENIKPVMNINELRIATLLAAKIPIDKDAEDFAKYLSRDANICLRAPKFDKTKVKIGYGLCEGCHYDTKNHICQKFTGGSTRMYIQLLSLGQAYAFWLGLKSVSKYLIYSIASDVVSHHLTVDIGKLKENKEYYGDIRKFIQKDFIDKCFEKVDDRNRIQEKMNLLINGKGKLGDLEEIIEFAREDLFTCVDILPYIIEYENVPDEMYGAEGKGISMEDAYKLNKKIRSKEVVSCADPEYIGVMKTINESIEKANLAEIMEKVNDIPPMHLRSLIQDQLYAVIHKIIMTETKEKWKKDGKWNQSKVK